MPLKDITWKGTARDLLHFPTRRGTSDLRSRFVREELNLRRWLNLFQETFLLGMSISAIASHCTDDFSSNDGRGVWRGLKTASTSHGVRPCGVTVVNFCRPKKSWLGLGLWSVRILVASTWSLALQFFWLLWFYMSRCPPPTTQLWEGKLITELN